MIAALGAVARILFEALYPLKEALRSPTAFSQLLRDLGHDVTVTPAALAGLDAAATVADLVTRGEELIDRLEQDTVDTDGVFVDLIALGQDLLSAVDGLRVLDGAQLDPALADVWPDLVHALPGYLLVAHLEAEVPLIYGLLRFCGVINDVEVNDGATREVLDGDQLARVAADPVGAIRERYGWGSALQQEKLLSELALMFTSLGLEVRTGPVEEPFAQRFFGAGATSTTTELVLPIVSGYTQGGYVDAGIALIPVPARPGHDVSELFLTNTHVGSAVAGRQLTDDWSVLLTGGLDATGLVGLRLTPTASTMEDAPPDGSATWTLVGEPPQPWLLLGGLVELGGLEVEISISGPAAEAEAELLLSVRTQQASVVFSLGDGDSFLRYLIGPDPLRVELSPTLQWSSRDGLRLSGTAGLEVILPLMLQLGVVLIERLHLSLTGDGATTRLQADVGATVEIGPLVATVAGIGMAIELSSGDQTGSLGSLDLRVAFVPPYGIGFAVVSPVASGGGYLESRPDIGRYAGVLDLDLLGVGVTAVGILSTQLPDGGEGWSLFFSLSVTFTGLQLGFGFTLNGVGGLIGVHRGLDDVALGDAIRAGSLDSVLFPDDPIADAATIISDTETIFPGQEGQFVFGPVAKIGWGTPTIVEIELGVVVELPDPITFTLLGALSAVLPDEDAAVLVLNIDVAGVFDLTAGTVAVDASLRDSRVAGFSLSGDMAVRAEFLDQPSFLLSFGGFNPHFDAPGCFPDLNPLSVSLDTGDNLRIGMWGYFALSSNTVQFGAGADLWASAAGLTVEGHFSFDALIQFNPFLFVFELSFEVDVQAGGVELFGVHLDLMVEGPNPFHVVGSASLKVLGVKTTFALDETIGDRELEGPRETVYATTLLVAAIQDPGAWREVPPAAAAAAVILADDDSADGSPQRVHPAGALEVVQRIVPLKRTLEHYGAARLGDLNRFELLQPTLGGRAPDGVTDVYDWFASTHYYRLTDEERLSAPSFEEMPAGLRFDAAGTTAGPAAPFVLNYEQVIRDPDLAEIDRTPDTVYTPTVNALAAALRQSALTRARPPGLLSTTRTGRSPYTLRPSSWVVTNASTGRVDKAVTSTADDQRLTWSQARGALLAADDGHVLTASYETTLSNETTLSTKRTLSTTRPWAQNDHEPDRTVTR